MHELSICASIADIVGRHASGRRVERVVLDVGSLRQVVPDTLRYSWEIVVEGTDLHGSTLVIEQIPAVLACRSCGTETMVTIPVFHCPCGSTDVDVVRGRELLVRTLEFAGGD